MLKFKHTGFTILPSSPPLLHFSSAISISFYTTSISMAIKFPKNYEERASISCCFARRRVRYDKGEEDEEYGHNAEIVMLEEYSISARDEVLLVRAMVDEQEAQVLVYKGFSSSLSYETSSDPSRSVLPARAVIKSIDRIRGPFDPSNIYFLEKGLTWDIFKTRIQPN